MTNVIEMECGCTFFDEPCNPSLHRCRSNSCEEHAHLTIAEAMHVLDGSLEEHEDRETALQIQSALLKMKHLTNRTHMQRLRAAMGVLEYRLGNG